MNQKRKLSQLRRNNSSIYVAAIFCRPYPTPNMCIIEKIIFLLYVSIVILTHIYIHIVYYTANTPPAALKYAFPAISTHHTARIEM